MDTTKGIPSRSVGYYARALWSLTKARWQLRRVNTLGTNVRMYGSAYVSNEGQINLGDKVLFIAGPVPVELTTRSGGVIDIGRSSDFNYGCIIVAHKRVSIGERCRFGYYVIILDTDMHRLEPERRGEVPEPAPVTIENDVWVGSRAMIMPGVTLGAGCVVAAGSIVTKDVPPRSVVAGVPAKVIRVIP